MQFILDLSSSRDWTPFTLRYTRRFHQGLQFLHRSRLDHIIIDTALERLFASIITAETGDGHDTTLSPAVLALHVSDRFGRGEAVHDLHRHVHEDEHER